MSAASGTSSSVVIYSGSYQSSQEPISQAVVSSETEAASEVGSLCRKQLIAYCETVFDPERDIATMESVKASLNQTAEQIMASRKRIDDAITFFYTESMKCHTILDELNVEYLKFRRAKDPKAQDVKEDIKYFEEYYKPNLERIRQIPDALMALEKENTSGRITDFKGLLGLLFLARKEEVVLLQTRLGELRVQEDHDLKNWILIQNQALKREDAILDMILKKERFTAEQVQAAFNRAMTVREQDRKEKADDNAHQLAQREQDRKEKRDASDLMLEQARLASAEKLEVLKVQNHAAIDASRIEAEKSVQMAKLGVEERCKIAEGVVKVAQPNCVIC